MPKAVQSHLKQHKKAGMLLLIWLFGVADVVDKGSAGKQMVS
ncbi:hypothetical protein [Brackiella oedipodis]|nr:hypothetical protein [Brackiella oedipodis]